MKFTIFQKKQSKIWNAKNGFHIDWNNQLTAVSKLLKEDLPKDVIHALCELRNNLILDYNEDIIEPVDETHLNTIYKFQDQSIVNKILGM